MNIRIKSFILKHTWSIPVATALVLRLFMLTSSSIWHDEGYTMWLIRYNPLEIIARTARDVHPPGYYLIAKFWTALFGSSVFSIRFLSLIFSIGIVFITYKIVELIWNKKAAYWSSMIVSFSPFMIRFGQEARMYGVIAFFTTLAAYYFIRYVKEKNFKYLYFFVPSMIVAMYTQYYSFFAIISFWIILAMLTPGFLTLNWKKSFKQVVGIFDYKWWLANILLLILYIPWFYIAYKQVTRISGDYWIKPEWINIATIPSNVLQLFTYSHLDFVYNELIFGDIIYWFITVIAIFSGLLLLLIKDKQKMSVLSLYVYGYMPMVFVLILSKLRTPIYQDRYFIFSSIAIFIIWGCLISEIGNKYIRIVTGSIFLGILLSGVVYMHIDVNHQMKQVYDQVNAVKQKSDIVLSSSLYTFLDGSYYFGYGNIRLIPDSVIGYGETSLFYDQVDKYVVNREVLDSLGNRIWVIGKPNDEIIEETPLKDWQVNITIERKNIKAVLYTR
ncbi:MAG: glycosyltransferase family 39 protein [bacterium]